MTGLLQVLLDASVRIGVVGVLVGTALFGARIRSSSLRHKAWLVVLCAMILMPALPRVTPRIEVATPSVRPDAPDALVATATPAVIVHTVSNQTRPSAELRRATEPAWPGAASPARSNPVSLASILVAIYAGGLIVFLARIFYGWMFARRLVGTCRATSIQGVAVYECAGIGSPLTVGVFRQRILFPENWSAWPEDKVRAVLAHELAHVRRRDTAANFLAHLNRCCFWFHPLAWWLERQLAVAAEEICDDAGVLAVGASRKYAEVLMDVAESAHRRHQRLALQGVGVDGSGMLTQRIERLLRGVQGEARGWQKVLVAAVCAGAVFAAAACQQKAAAALKADPEYAKQIAPSVAANQVWGEINRMTAADAEALEASLRQNPEDAAARKKLARFYGTSGRKLLGDERATKGFWSIQLWCIEHTPDDACSWEGGPLFDPVAFQQGAKLWDSVLRRSAVTKEQQVNAIRYFERVEPERAEQIARTASIDENARTRLLSAIYTSALTGAATQTAYAQDVRKRLDQSKDATLLAATGLNLARFQPPESPRGVLGRKYIDRAVALDPNSPARNQLANVEQTTSARQEYLDMAQAVGTEVSDAQYQKASALPADRRALYLPRLAEEAYWGGATAKDSNHDDAKSRADWELARRYGKEALAVEAGFRGDPDYSTRVYQADLVLAMLAERADGNSKEADKYLLAAAPLKTANDTWFPTTLKLLVLLLRYGNADDRAAVIQFCEIHGNAVNYRGVDLTQSAQKLRRGVMPTWYQFEVTQFPGK